MNKLSPIVSQVLSLSKVRNWVKSASAEKSSQELFGVALCSAEVEELSTDFQLRRALKPLLEFKKIRDKKICNPNLFRGTPMVTTFVRSTGGRTKDVWQFLEKASRADIRLAELEHPSFQKILSYCSGRVIIYVHPSFYRSLKLRFSLDCPKMAEYPTELGSDFLRHAVGILTSKDFQNIIDTD